MEQARDVSMAVRSAAPGVAVVEVSGTLTAAGEDVLMDAHERATDAGARTVVLDLGGLEYMNSGGIGLLVTLLVRCQRRQQRLAAAGLSEHYRRIFRLTRLDDVISLHADATSAVAAAGSVTAGTAGGRERNRA